MTKSSHFMFTSGEMGRKHREWGDIFVIYDGIHALLLYISPHSRFFLPIPPNGNME